MKYYIKQYGESASDAREVPESDWCMHPEEFAEFAAEYYHDNEDGWEAQWPIEFTVIDDEGKEHEVAVERESMPQFSATLKR